MRIKIEKINRLSLICLFALMAVGMSVNTASAQSSSLEEEIKQEIKYIEGLMQIGIHDYAKRVLEEAKAKYPSASVDFEIISVRSLLAYGNFDEVKKIIAKKPDQKSQEVWGMRLALADGYHAHGRFDEASAIYSDFMKAYPNGPTPALNRFYIDSLHRFAQMLLMIDQRDDALKAYRALGKAKLEDGIKRQILCEKAELMLNIAEESPADRRKSLFKEVGAIAEEITWIQDVWFGKAVVMMAHIKMMQNKVAEAQEMIEDYKDILKQIDDNLKDAERSGQGNYTALSPMAECRYLLGKMMYDKALILLKDKNDTKKATEAGILLAGRSLSNGGRSEGALKNFYYVFLDYPSTQWAPAAGSYIREIEDILLDVWQVSTETDVTPEKMAKVSAAQYQSARSFFFQNKFKDAAEGYVRALNQFPERSEAVSALGDLYLCYLELNDPLYASMVVGYMMEHLAHKSEYSDVVGRTIIKIAEAAGLKNPEEKERIYDQFINNCPSHPRAQSLAYNMGKEMFKAGKYEQALTYFVLSTKSSGTDVYYYALDNIAVTYSKLGKKEEEMAALKASVKALEARGVNDSRLLRGYLNLAGGYRRHKEDVRAINAYNALIKKIYDPKNNYLKGDAEGIKKNQAVLISASFYKAVCYSQLTSPAANVPGYKTTAIKILLNIAGKYETSEYAPAALTQVGKLYLKDKKFEEAEKVFTQLERKYPDSSYAKNSLYMRARALFEVGERTKAVAVFKKMLTGDSKYPASQIVGAAMILAENGENEVAMEAFRQAIKISDNPSIRQNSMVGIGRCLVDLGRYKEGIVQLEAFMKEFSKSAMVIPAGFQLSRAYSEVAKDIKDREERVKEFNKAIDAINVVIRQTSDSGMRSKCKIEIARIAMRKAAAETSPAEIEKHRNDAMAAYQSIIIMSNPDDAKVKPYIMVAYDECLPIMADAERWADISSDVEKYLELFPDSKGITAVRLLGQKARQNQTVVEEIKEEPTPEEAVNSGSKSE